MKLAEALNERADIQRRIAQLKDRLRDNAKVQEGEAPSEEPEVLFGEINRLFVRLEELIVRINKTNMATVDENNETLVELIARRDCWIKRVRILEDFADHAGMLTVRMTRSEIKVKSTVNIHEKRQEADALSRDIRKLDIHIQQLNWLTELK